MDSATTDCGAFDETVVFLSYFKNLADPRQQGKVTYPLDEILLLCLLGVLAGAETFVDIALFGTKKLAFLRRLRPFSDGTPAHDHLGDILAALDAEQFQRCFAAWVAALIGAPDGVIAIDGKTVRRSHQKKAGKAAIHMVSAFAARQRGRRLLRPGLVLGQVKVADKSNEIVAIPMMSPGFRNATLGPASTVLSSSRAAVRLATRSSARHAFISPLWSCWPILSGRSCAVIGRSRTACIGFWTWYSATTSAGSEPRPLAATDSRLS
jgi:hypothetical protein